MLLACVQLKLFDLPGATGPAPIETLAGRRWRLPPEGCRRLLDAGGGACACWPAASGVASQRSTAWGPLGAPMVGNTAIAAMVEHHVLLYADLADPVAMLRGGARPG